MKKRSLLIVLAMLSVFLFGIGTAYAIYGVADDVKGQDLVWPMFCVETPGPSPAPNNSAATSLNTNWAIAELIGGTTDLNGYAVTANCTLWSQKSTLIFDFVYTWSPFQVVIDDCQSLLTRHPGGKLVDNNLDGTPDLRMVIDGVNYWGGYITCTQAGIIPIGQTLPLNALDRFMNNVYLVDLPLGFASGLNGPSLEGIGAPVPPVPGGATIPSDAFFGEFGPAFHITAGSVYARYYVNNDPLTNPNTWNWLIFLLGRNQYNITDFITSTRVISGVICDENEHCASLTIPIWWELNVINVDPLLPGSPFFTPLGNINPGVPQTFPKAGFVAGTVVENGSRAGFGNFTITGTANHVDASAIPFYSMFGWSYQRAQAGTNILGDYDVIHNIYRTYCSGAVPGSGPPDNQTNCVCSPSGSPGPCDGP